MVFWNKSFVRQISIFRNCLDIMLTFYIVISILWGILIFLNTFKEYKWYSSLIFSIVGILFWPVFILAAIIVEIIRLCKNEEPDVDSSTSDEMKRESVFKRVKW